MSYFRLGPQCLNNVYIILRILFQTNKWALSFYWYNLNQFVPCTILTHGVRSQPSPWGFLENQCSCSSRRRENGVAPFNAKASNRRRHRQRSLASSFKSFQSDFFSFLLLREIGFPPQLFFYLFMAIFVHIYLSLVYIWYIYQSEIIHLIKFLIVNSKLLCLSPLQRPILAKTPPLNKVDRPQHSQVLILFSCLKLASWDWNCFPFFWFIFSSWWFGPKWCLCFELSTRTCLVFYFRIFVWYFFPNKSMIIWSTQNAQVYFSYRYFRKCPSVLLKFQNTISKTLPHFNSSWYNRQSIVNVENH